MVNLFSSKARVKVMELFLLNSGNSFYQRQISELTGQPIRAVQREIEKLENMGLIEKRTEGNRSYYSTNKNNPIYNELRMIFLKTTGVAEYLKKTVKNGSIITAFIYGSYAENNENINSDIDVFIIGSITGRELTAVLSGAKEELAREINYILMTPDEFARKAQSGDHFVRSVVENAKIFIAGDENDLKEIAGPGKAKAAQNIKGRDQ
jgi:predicted nucleotidyltransferase